MFSWECWEIFKNTYFEEHLQTATFDITLFYKKDNCLLYRFRLQIKNFLKRHWRRSGLFIADFEQVNVSWDSILAETFRIFYIACQYHVHN